MLIRDRFAAPARDCKTGETHRYSRSAGMPSGLRIDKHGARRQMAIGPVALSP
ncbi:hypothetical protein I603_2542 [Erythrobacter dokdonensis DSW-74]|uniref:Uncharacterized protein n=1 Tax=Erythrobacter dokdonensis DSW-74 TaxID=1300349 RepID=A0A1A7BDZ9_9SPHN|nr:hypothetical protein I603_2542 [Erythrobacter dokdonensis DSW-74]